MTDRSRYNDTSRIILVTLIGKLTTDDLSCNFSFCSMKYFFNGSWNLIPTNGTAANKLMNLSNSSSLKAIITANCCMCILMTAFPMSVAPKNVQNGMR